MMPNSTTKGRKDTFYFFCCDTDHIFCSLDKKGADGFEAMATHATMRHFFLARADFQLLKVFTVH
jgi:hypothetical protein